MFYCVDCDTEFDEPQICEERHGLTEPPYEQRWLCPICGSGEFVAMRICKICHLPINPDEVSDQDDDIHVACANDTLGEWDKIKASTLDSCFSPEQVQFLKDCEV